MGAGTGFSQTTEPVAPGLTYKGTWNANTNTPALASGVGVQGDFYIVSVEGSTNLDGITDWGVGDWAIFNGTVWQKIDNSDTSNSTVNTTDFATTTTLQTIVVPTNSVVFIETNIPYRKTGGAGTGTTGDGAAFKLSVCAKNVAGTATLTGPIQNSYTGTTIDTETATFSTSGGNVLIRVNGILNDNITWNSFTKVSTVS